MATHDSDDDLDDILKDVTNPEEPIQSTENPPQPQYRSNKNSDTAGGLGVDEEIVITKKRQPAPKLDDQRLLSDPGIPRLRKISKDRLRFKGKGHEYGDIARMLNMYQLWLDDLYPRAKFADALAIIEKVGHTKRMQLMRKDWIDEGKPRRNTGQDEDDDDAGREKTPQQSTEDMEGVENGGQEDAGHPTEREASTRNATGDAAEPPESGDPDDDELDALLAESEQPSYTAPKTLPTRPMPTQDDPFADDMEAMAEMDDMWD
ncbi:chromosome segregation in meiosis- protein [Alternaria incomplexa]|uniref:chromosome segregation in meiosis- protein n=1 Tax=Alternaria triticimaculans TaxID=297637 RepID=UPI0020C36355|nr:chromosome segregation in meiosis- protein [Alternaria triticimaculans]XP_051295251.1 chromosome segregation in meiosis- protein [Alternaria incomplexa]XP_051353945.1 chromosome segregation in meiosis- protein [Alternaria infectoria]KAI4700745.1 chromosome segregation in meiosis- protein [Alternaria sp. BMP 2799]KAI4642694.1 chromosome segregation in meiosis- protein [Alternaria triticimaculans]KAI4921740.1 chromosome segregation in meiosis- protein [Alternaria incomplexa]KAI4930883.1 chro